MFSSVKKIAVTGLLMSSLVGGAAMAGPYDYITPDSADIYGFASWAKKMSVDFDRILCNTALGNATLGVSYDNSNAVPPGYRNDLDGVYMASCNGEVSVQ